MKNIKTKKEDFSENFYDQPFIKKKSLGQNFLKSKKALFSICEAGDLSKEDTILEIGPGKGALTEKLLERGSRVIAVEKDSRLLDFLNSRFEKEIQSGQLTLLNQDILEFNVSKIKKYKIIANIPYNITGAIIKKFLDEKNKPEKMALLVQKEVAQRIVASDKKESVLSISVKSYGNPSYIMTVQKKYFSPAPKVDSAIVLIDNISNKNFKSRNCTGFFNLVKEGFSHKRKMLISNLNKKIKNKDLLEKVFEESKIDQKARPEDISIDQWFAIFDNKDSYFKK